jgi:antitoxin component of MazEF toxin-antitoxin module
MKDLNGSVTEAGLRVEIPPEMVEELGWRSGQQVTIRASGDRITISPTADLAQQIQSRALAYLARRVGDATTVGAPTHSADRWEVAVYLSYADRQLGVLRFSERGELLPDESTPPVALRGAADAA